MILPVSFHFILLTLTMVNLLVSLLLVTRKYCGHYMKRFSKSLSLRDKARMSFYNDTTVFGPVLASKYWQEFSRGLRYFSQAFTSISSLVYPSTANQFTAVTRCETLRPHTSLTIFQLSITYDYSSSIWGKSVLSICSSQTGRNAVGRIGHKRNTNIMLHLLCSFCSLQY